MTFTIIPVFSVAIAVSILMGQESARKDIASAKYLAISAALLNMLLMLLIATVLIAAAPEIICLFAP
jgi:Na+-driven multidrug efflux pump